MIVFHDFFYKAHPHYLDRAIEMMQKVNKCGFAMHSDLDIFVKNIREALKEDSGGRYDRGDIRVSVYSSLIQIEVKNGEDYAARIDYFILEKGLAFRMDKDLSPGELFQMWKFDPVGQLQHVNKEVV